MSDDGRDTVPESRPPARGDRGLWFWLGALVLFWLGYLALFGPRTPTGDFPPPVLADPGIGQADFSWTLETPDGELVELSDYRGRPIVLNLWATWCGPCILEMPSLQSLAENPELDHVAVLAVSWEDRETLVRSDQTAGSPSIWLRSPSIPPAMYITDAIPATFVIAPDGRVAAFHLGAAQWDHPSVVSFLKSLESRMAARPGHDPPAT